MKRSKFSLSHYKLFTGNMGTLIPCGLLEVLPGDTIQHSTSALVRCSPLLAPVMHPVSVRIHHWYVPHRLVWEDFEAFITGGPDGNDASVFPTIDMGGSGAAIGSLADYLGVPTGVANLVVSALPFRGYAKIFNEWYRDQDLQTALTIDETSGADSTTSTALQNVAWDKDYFTSARPWEQKGPDISLPLGERADVLGIAAGPSVTFNQTPTGFVQADGSAAPGTNWSPHIDNTTASAFRIRGDNTSKAPDIYADLSTATAASVNALREAFALQRFEEARARYGSRYTEYLRYLGIRSSDARLQRPEYLGGGKQTIQFSEVLQTGPTTSGSELGVADMKGHGISALRSNRYRRFIEEHGYVYSFFSVKPKAMYIDGLDRHWSRTTKEDFWQRELEHIGQMPILNKEVRASHATPDGTFGYQDRYDEYRRAWSKVSGQFRNSTLNFWHFARTFGSDPALNEDFIKCVPTEVPFAVPSEDVLWCMTNHSIQARRLVSASGHSYIF